MQKVTRSPCKQPRKAPWAKFSGGMSGCSATEGGGTMPEQISRNLAHSYGSVQDISFPSTRSYKHSESEVGSAQDPFRTQPSDKTTLLLTSATRLDQRHAPTCTSASASCDATTHPSPDPRSPLFIQLIKITLLDYFLSDNDLVLVIVSKLYLSGKLQLPSLDCLVFPWY